MTGAQRRNARMDKIFDRAKSEGRGLGGSINKSKSKALEKAKVGSEKHYQAWKKAHSGTEALKKASDSLRKHQENN